LHQPCGIEFGQAFIEFGQAFIEFGQAFIEFGQAFIEFGQLIQRCHSTPKSLNNKIPDFFEKSGI